MNEYEKEEWEREESQLPPQPEEPRIPEDGPAAPAEAAAPEDRPAAPAEELSPAEAEPPAAETSAAENAPAPEPAQPAPAAWQAAPGQYQGGGYYAPPRAQSPWGGQYQPSYPPQQGWPGWQQQPQWRGPNTTGWAQQGGQGGYQPQGQPTGRWEAGQAAASEKKKKKRRPLRVVLTLLGVLAALAVVTMAGYGIYAAATGENPLAEKQPGQMAPSLPGIGEGSGGNKVPDIAINDKPGSGEDRYDGSEEGTLSNAAIFKKVSPSVVGVVARLGESVYGNVSQGSGIIMSEDGYIITNAHVVEGAVSYEVVLTGGETYPAQLVGADRNSDLAVLKVNQTGLAYAEFGDSDQIEVGERACVIGNPGGLRFQNSLTVGYISALKRTINTGGYSIDCIQTDAAINPGNSGGPLINAYGQVIGISSAKIALTDYEGICFAIPITDAMPILRQLIADGKVTGRAMLGIGAKAVKASEAEYYEIPMGLWVVSITPGADIGTKGVREGDIITHVADMPVYSLDACSNVLKDYKPGDTVTVTVFRRESSMTDNTFKVDVVLQGS